ncbi:MAG TPA: hypothetical protein VLM75_05135 [Spirochaetota bacterium]|nr:hypothetical protein [Spirochaetota bacterium]
MKNPAFYIFFVLFAAILFALRCSDLPKDPVTLSVLLTDNGTTPDSFSGWYRIDGGSTRIIDAAQIIYLGSNIYEFTVEADELDTLDVSVTRQDANDTLEIMIYRDSAKVKEDRLSSGAAGNDLQLTYTYGEESTGDDE